jgi:hypothetical protein
LVTLYRQRVSSEQSEVHEHFYNRYLRQSPECRSQDDLIAFCKETKLDLILTGSDAVFRLSEKLDRQDTRFPNPFWLMWVKSSLASKSSTASLAASAMGTNYFSYPHSVRAGISEAIRNISYVSVRDRWTQLMLFVVSWGRVRPTLCPDPVVVLNEVFSVPKEYERMSIAENSRYILLSVYEGMLSEEWIRDFVKIAHNAGVHVFSIPFPEDVVNLEFVDKVISLPLSPLEWYSWIQNASGFVGVRMHPVLSCMINDVPFISFDTYTRGRFNNSSKIYDLCVRAGVAPYCMNSVQRRDLRPQQAFEMLRSKEQGNAKKYTIQAKSSFSRTINRILRC